MSIAKEIGGMIITGVSKAELSKVPKLPEPTNNDTIVPEPVKVLAESQSEQSEVLEERESDKEKSEEFMDFLHNFKNSFV
jgi:hypothetical protein